MTTFSNLPRNTFTLFRLFSRPAIKLAKEAPIVLGFRRDPRSERNTPSYLDLNFLRNVDASTVDGDNKNRSASMPWMLQGSPAPQPPASNRPTPIKVQLPVNASWLHDKWPPGKWEPGQVRARIAAFEQLAAAPASTSPRSSASVTPVNAKQQEPTPSTLPKTKRQAPMPPSTSAPAPARSMSVPAQTVTPPRPPTHADAGNPVTRSNSCPPLETTGKALFAELKEHPLVRRTATSGSTETTGEVKAGTNTSQQKAPSLDRQRLSPFQLDLKKRLEKINRVAPIVIKPEVQHQAEELRIELETKRQLASGIHPGKAAEPTTPGSGTSASGTSTAPATPAPAKEDLMAELKRVLSAQGRNTQNG